MQGLVSKAAALGYVSPLAALALLLLIPGCGDDDGVDAGDANMDGGEDGGGFIRPRVDGQIGTDPVPECNRFDPLACGAGERCQVVIRRAVGAEQFLIYSGCIEDTEARGPGDPCEPWGGAALAYRADGLEDELYVDPCDDGLFCAPDPVVRGSSTCQRTCESGRFEGQLGIACGSASEYCTGPGPYEEVCRESDDCNPASEAGCGAGTGCYLRLNDTGSGVLTVCLPTVEMPIGDGMPCQFLNDCNPGSSCWGPTRVPPARWATEDLICRPTCAAGGDDDAGAGDEDAGTGLGAGTGCSAAAECVAFEGSGLDLSTVDPSLGQCE